MTTKLQDALIESGLTNLDFMTGGKAYPVAVEDLPDETLLRVMEYGKRIFNDAVNGAAHQGKDRETFALEWMEKAKAGTLGARTGGGKARISDRERFTREVVEEWLRKAGWQAKDAKKDAKEPEAAFKTMLGLAIARGKGIAANKVSEADIEAAFEKNWGKVEAVVERKFEEAKKDDWGIDLG